MNTLPGNIIVDSCQYTPVYLVQDTGAIQGSPYILSQGNVPETKPVTDNLKRFYENSGIFENNLTSNVPNITKPRILKKQDNILPKNRNNLKLASFLLPKQNNNHRIISKPCIPVSNFILKPTVVTANVVHTAPREDVDRKIVKIKNFPECLKKTPRVRAIPKIKPKEDTPPTPPVNKFTSVQLLKLGDTYHSINQLTDEQMKMVNKALKIFSNPEKTMEPLYDPATNTHYVYKVVSPRDLTVVCNNKLVVNEKKNDEEGTKKEQKKGKPHPPEKEINLRKLKPVQVDAKEIPPNKDKLCEFSDEEFDIEPKPEEIKVTRSGRQVKFPKQIVPETPQKPKKKSMSCFQCATEFCSFYRLQKHYETHPTHIPAKIHSNLFNCLLAIIKSDSVENSANIFIDQLEQLIEKLKSLIPCLLNQLDSCEGLPCKISDDIGRLFGVSPGNYNLNLDALTCVKDKDGYCRHNPSNKNKINAEKPIQSWIPTHSNDNTVEVKKSAIIYDADKPTVKKRIWKSKKQKTKQLNLKKIKLSSEKSDPILELGLDDLVNFSTIEQSAINVEPKSMSMLDDLDVIDEINNPEQLLATTKNSSLNYTSEEPKKIDTGSHSQFHSTHFDIRSSPIKPSTAIFRKIQINPDKLPKYEVQIIQPIEVDVENQNAVEESGILSPNDTPDIQSLLKDDIVQMSPSKQPSLSLQEINFDTTKDWILDTVTEKSNESFLKTTGAIEPSLLHIQEYPEQKSHVDNHVESNELIGDCENSLLSSQNASVLNFLESLGNECLLYPETDIRNNHVESVDFHLDLFSFSNP